jgi:serine/threonine protein kinase/Flp pilus assembly protein TadD
MTQAVSRHGSTGHPAGPAEDVTQAARRGARAPSRAKTGDASYSPTLPCVGQEVLGFRLRQELGRGAYACVFLAEQANLASRPVALKITDLEGDEPQTLAQLQHTHIVPIYSVHEDAEARLRAVCMPYFGGASLADVLKTLWAEPHPPVNGEQLVRALQEVPNPTVAQATRLCQPPATEQEEARAERGAAPATAGESDPAPLTVLRGLTYVRAAAWIVAHLAEALQHAHQRGVIHRDIKPSNVLLGADGQPMLLDFNVAQTSRHSQARAVLGGTIAYMAPEHLQAMANRDKALAARLDHRADIYSLGMVLYEMLAGGRPFGSTASYSRDLSLLSTMALERRGSIPSLRQKRSSVPWSLESIIRKCLAPDPAQRYQRAEHLAEDLRRFLGDRPLKHAPELSWRERMQKWLRRHPRLTSSGSVAAAAAVLLVALGASWYGIREHLARTAEALAVAQAQERKEAYEAGTVRALCLINTTNEAQDHLLQGIKVCEETLAIYGVLDADDWQASPHWRRLHANDQQALAEDTRELLLSLAWAKVQTASTDRAVPEKALALLDRAQAVAGLAPSRAIWEDRARYLDLLNRTTEAKTARATAQHIPPTSARDHYLLAMAHARYGRHAEAVRELDQALRLNPQHYWSLVQRGICHQEMGKFTLATGDFGACIGLWPRFAWGYFNRGYVLEKSGNRLEAINDYTAALERDPEFLLAYLNRGLARLELKQYAPALADFRKAEGLGRNDVRLHLGMGVALEGLGRHEEADAAFQATFGRADSVPPEVRTRLSWVYGFAVSQRLPGKARQAFGDVLRQHPDHPQALYGQAMLLVRDGQERQAITLFNQAIEACPTFSEARRFRAVLLARSNQLDAASGDINWCLEREPESGATLYAAACVASLALEKCSNPSAAKQLTDQAVTFLRRAFAHGYGREQAAEDADLKALRQLPEFSQLLKAGNL